MFAGTRTDYLILLLALAGIAGSWFIVRAGLGNGAPTAYIYRDKVLLATYPLPDDDRVIHFDADGKLGVSEISIDHHGVRITSSPCTTQRCVLSGVHKHIGDMVACVPNHILVSIRGSGSADGSLDAVVE